VGNPGKAGIPGTKGNPGSKPEGEGNPGSKPEEEGSLTGVDTAAEGTDNSLADTRTGRLVGNLGTWSLAPPLSPHTAQLDTRSQAPPWPLHVTLRASHVTL